MPMPNSLNLVRMIMMVVLMLSFLPKALDAQEKPLLSEAIKKSIDTKGIEAAKEQFQDVDKMQQQYVVDMEGIINVGSAYGQSGEYEKTQAYMEIAGPFLQFSGNMPVAPPEPPAPPKESKPVVTVDRGPAREDLDKFTGMYTDPKLPTRQLFVMPTCDGYLVVGPMWADVAPWIMTSVADNMFNYSDQYNDITLEFLVEDGQPTMMHNVEGLASTIERTGPIPDEFGTCHETRR
jgi:hypothetical protein